MDDNDLALARLHPVLRQVPTYGGSFCIFHIKFGLLARSIFRSLGLIAASRHMCEGTHFVSVVDAYKLQGGIKGLFMLQAQQGSL